LELTMDTTYRIIVGIDGSEGSARALDWAADDAARRNRAGQPTTVQAVTAWSFDPSDEPEGVAIRLPDPRQAAEELLAATVADTLDRHPDAVIAAEVVEGVTSDVLVRASDEADLLVLGSHGHTRMYHAVLGSVAEACIRAATCPVLVIPMARAASHPTGAKAMQSTGG
jgi:nucleotide-binding universal stress UspA family protein